MNESCAFMTIILRQVKPLRSSTQVWSKALTQWFFLKKKKTIYENIDILTFAHNIASGDEHIDCICKYDECIFM